MLPEFFESYDPADAASLARFEEKLGMPLPAAYRRFLAGINGGRPEPEFFRGPSGRVHELPIWYGLDENAGEGPYNLILRHRVGQLLFRAPHSWICIARSWDGNLVFLSLTGEDAGHLYLWFHDARPNQIWDKGPADESFAQRLERMGIAPLADGLDGLLSQALNEHERRDYFDSRLG